MSKTVKCYIAHAADSPLVPGEITRRACGPKDISIKTVYAGICHSDLHTVRGEWQGVKFPVCPGHEIVGHVDAVGSEVTKFKVGDLAGVGCMVDSCRKCGNCHKGLEQFCQSGASFTYNSTLQDKQTPTQGGYSQGIVVDEAFALHIPKALEHDLKSVAPLLCAGITTFSPLRHWKVKAGDKVAVNGLGGLGHMAVKLAAAMGAEVTMLSTSSSKKDDATKLGAKHFLLSSEDLSAHNGTFDFIIDTVSATHDINKIVSLLKVDATLCIVGAPPGPTPIGTSALIFGRKSIAGSLIGGVAETQEMLNFCAEHKVAADVEVIAAKDIESAYARLLKSDVKYRFVIDASTF